jgi:putative serine protease PepD
VVGASVLAATLASGATFAGVQALDEPVTAAPTSGSTPDGPVEPGDATSPDWAAVASAVAPSVVTIQVSSQAGSGQGSGVILDAEGNILTNNHVVSGAGEGATVNVVLADGRVFSGVEVVGLDPTTDLAVLRLADPPADLELATLGSSGDVFVGQEVMAVGNPLGLSDTVTTGIVSALDRPVTTQEQPQRGRPGQSQSEQVVTNAIQTDAAINPGNSGGALVDTTGAVIGINSSIASTSAQAGSIGLGFAIPIDEAKRIADELLVDGTADHALLGVSLQDGSGTAEGTTRLGAQVADVVAGSAAQDAGLQAGDTVVAVDGDGVTGAESLTAQVRERAPGTEVTLTVVRDGQSLDVPVVLDTREG